MAQLQTARLRMESWTLELVEATLRDKAKLGHLLKVKVPYDFPNQAVLEHMLPAMLVELERDASIGVWSGMIIHLADSTIIGSMGFKSPPDIHGVVEIGYDVIPAYQGKGYATEMARELISWAFEQPSVTCVRAECLGDNDASRRVLEKVGMQLVGAYKTILKWELQKS